MSDEIEKTDVAVGGNDRPAVHPNDLPDASRMITDHPSNYPDATYTDHPQHQPHVHAPTPTAETLIAAAGKQSAELQALAKRWGAMPITNHEVKFLAELVMLLMRQS